MVYNSHTAFKNDKIYFVLVDRFHDGVSRHTVSSKIRKQGFGEADELSGFYGGTLKGITHKLFYIRKMGFTALWLSPFFHNTSNAYHGYAIKDFTEVDPRFGTKDDLKILVSTAHEMGLKVYMDVIINHIGNVWSYINQQEFRYNQGMKYPFGKWNDHIYPKPASLRNENLYEKRGMILNWDKYPELLLGDFFELKKFKLDETDEGLYLQNIMFEVYAYWVKEFDFDGLRIDTARHIKPLTINRFTHKIKNVAASNGKEEFPVFIEAPFLNDEELLPYFTIQKDHLGNCYNCPDGFLDFYLHFDLPSYVSSKKGVKKLWDRFKSISNTRRKAESPMHQISFLDNHDQVAEDYKSRIANKLNNLQILDSWNLLLESDTTPCLYYGSEQGFSGKGPHDKFLREAMFDKNTDRDLFDEDYILYKKIQHLNRNS